MKDRTRLCLLLPRLSVKWQMPRNSRPTKNSLNWSKCGLYFLSQLKSMILLTFVFCFKVYKISARLRRQPSKCSWQSKQQLYKPRKAQTWEASTVLIRHSTYRTTNHVSTKINLPKRLSNQNLRSWWHKERPCVNSTIYTINWLLK